MIRAAINGRLGNDPVTRDTSTGKAMVTASVAVNVAKPNEDAVTEWISIAAFGSVSEMLARHAKGDVVMAMGTLTRSTFTGRDGQERTAWSLLTESLLSARTVYDRPHDSTAAARPQRARAPRRSAHYKKPQRPPAGPPMPNDPVADLWQGEP
jgi:single-strand DNA-binding protein